MHSHKISYIFQLKYRQCIYIPLLNIILLYQQPCVVHINQVEGKWDVTQISDNTYVLT